MPSSVLLLMTDLVAQNVRPVQLYVRKSQQLAVISQSMYHNLKRLAAMGCKSDISEEAWL